MAGFPPGFPGESELSADIIAADDTANTMLLNILESKSCPEIPDDSGNPDEGKESSIAAFLREPNEPGGRARDGLVTRGCVFWVYPSSLGGACETMQEEDPRGLAGTIVAHALLVTVECDADVQEIERLILTPGRVPQRGIAHIHVKAAGLDLKESV